MPNQNQQTARNWGGFIWRKRSSVDPQGDPPKLAPAESFWMLVKVVCFLVLGFYNVFFFARHTHGFLTIITCFGAAFLEVCGFFCVLWWNRTSPKHRKALLTFGIIFMLISLVHATLGYYDMQPGSGWIGSVAFPLIFVTMMVASIVIPMAHWERDHVKKQIENELQLEGRICDMQTQLLELEAENKFQDAKSILLQTQIEQRARHMEMVKQMISARRAEKDFVWTIDDPEIRADAARLIDDQQNARMEFKALSVRGAAGRRPNPQWQGTTLLNPQDFTPEELARMGQAPVAPINGANGHSGSPALPPARLGPWQRAKGFFGLN